MPAEYRSNTTAPQIITVARVSQATTRPTQRFIQSIAFTTRVRASMRTLPWDPPYSDRRRGNGGFPAHSVTHSPRDGERLSAAPGDVHQVTGAADRVNLGAMSCEGPKTWPCSES